MISNLWFTGNNLSFIDLKNLSDFIFNQINGNL